MSTQSFRSVITKGPKGRTYIALPFDPDDVWGSKPAHHVAGTVGHAGVRAVVERVGDVTVIAVGPTWLRDRSFGVGDEVLVSLWPEGMQRDSLAPDLQEAFAAQPEAGAFFDGLAQFYRTAYIRWIDATKGKPDKRAERIDTVVGLLASGIKERPR